MSTMSAEYQTGRRQWVPTFANARYVFAKGIRALGDHGDEPDRVAVFNDSVESRSSMPARPTLSPATPV